MVRFSTKKNTFFYFLLSTGVWLISLVFFLTGSFGQTVVIPRSGYPYCQPFTGNDDLESLPFTVTRGYEIDFNTNPIRETLRSLSLTGQALRLTTADPTLVGYVFVDLPFSSVYGIKTSFEYFVHSPGTPDGLGDGLSFFMFDGAIQAADFEIGGVGGSLGYAPHGFNSGQYNKGGLKGGYMGIGFDIFGNFGNYQEKKYGGFHDPNQYNYLTPNPQNANVKLYPDAVTIRGPVNAGDAARRNGSPPADFNPLTAPYFDSYQFVSGKITSYLVGFPYPFLARVNNGSGDLFLDPSKSSFFLPSGDMFRLGSGLIPASDICNDSRYRKVFIDLRPTNNPSIPYTITVDMLVGTEIRNILNNVPYPYQAPTDLKVGFSASTGSNTFSIFDIRNVTVEVSSIDEALAPKPPILSREVCLNDETEFEFEVDLPAENSFISCIQLYEIDPGPADNSGSASNQFDCGLSGVCVEKCLDTRKTLTIAGKGTLIAELEELTQGPGGNFDSERRRAKLKFVPANGFIGTFTAYYQVTDNYGLESDGTLIEITINPEPQLIDDGDIYDPTCAGQNDGAIRNIIVRDLAPGYVYTWRDQSNNLVPVANQTFTSVPSGNYEEATFGLENINLGTYTLEITNPSVEAPCNLIISKTLDQEAGTPVIILDPITEICEQTSITYTPQVSSVYTNNVSAPPVYLWYTDPNRLNPIANNSTQLIVNGNPITTGLITIAGPGDGRLSIESLPQGTYTFYVEVDDSNFPTGGNFCLQRGVLEMVQLTVFPALQASVSEVADWCVAGQGSIAVTSVGGQGTPTFTLFDESGNQSQQNNTGNFLGLLPGDYTIEIETSSPTCFLTVPGTVEGPDQPLSITAGSTENSFCNDPNGEMSFTVSGGNPAPSDPIYTILINGNPPAAGTLSNSGNLYTLTGLAANSYTIQVTDTQNCTASISMSVAGDPPSVFGTTNDEICEGETATVSPQIINQSTSSPIFTWYYQDAGNYVEITSGSTVGGATYTIDGSNNLSVSGLTPQQTPYVYYLVVTGNKVCPQGYIPAEVLVNPLPKPVNPILQMVGCNGASDGSIQAQLSEGNLSDFQYALTGNNGINIGLSSNSGLFSGLPVGTYELTVRSSSGCEAVFPGISITEPPLLTVSITSKTDATCEEENGQLRFTIAGGTPDGSGTYQIQINGADISTFGSDVSVDSGIDFTISNLSPGSYLVEVEDSNGCLTSASEIILDTEVPVFAVQDIDVCEGQQAILTPETVINTIGAIPEFTWSYENPSNPGQFIPISNGDVVGTISYSVTNGILTITGLNYQADPYKYFLNVAGDKVCPPAPIEAEIRVLKVPSGTFDTVSISCFGESDGQIQLGSMDPFGSNTYTLVETGESNDSGNFTALSAGNYTVRVQENGSPCFADFPLTIAGPTASITVNDPTIIRSSCDLNNGSISNLVVSGGYGNYTAEWRQGSITGPVISSSLTGVSDLFPDTYFLSITDSGGCIAEFSFTVEESSDPVYEIVPLINDCLGNSVVIRPIHIAPDPSLPPAAATEVIWSTESGQVGIIQNGIDPTMPGVTHTIDDSDWLNPELVIDGLPVGTHDFYFFVVCTGQEIKVDVTVFDTPAVVFESQPVSCFGDSDGKIESISGAEPDYTYSIDGASPISLTDLEAMTFAAGTYQIQVNTPAGCPQLIDLQVEGPVGPLEIVLLSELDPSCNLENGEVRLQLNGGNPAYSLTLNGVEISGFDASLNGVELLIENLPGGTHVFELTDSKTCPPATLIVTLDPLEVPEFDATGTEICAFDTSTGLANTGILQPVIINLAGSSPIFTWFYINSTGAEVQVSNGDQVFGGTAQISPTGELELTGVSASDTPYKFLLEVTGPLVCPQPKIEVDFLVNFTPEVILEKTDIACFGETTGEISVLSGALPGYSYTLSTGQSNDTGTFSNLPAGNYTVEISNGSICTQTIPIEIVQPDELLINDVEFTDPTCDASNGEIIFSVTGGTPAYEVLINNLPLTTSNYSFSNNAGVFTVQNLPPGNYSISVRDGNGCEALASNLFTLTNNPGIEIDSQPISDEICEGQTAQLTPDLTVPVGVTPILRWYKDAAATQQITSSPTPDVDGIVYQINAQGVLSVTNLTAGAYNYYLRISGPGICTLVTEATLTVVALPTVALNVSNISCFGENDGAIQVSTGHDPTFVYSLSSGGSNSTGEFLNLASGNYTLEVENTSGCIQEIDFEILEPAELIINDLDFTNPTCDQDNGEITFEITGGTGAYTILINGQELNDSNFAFIPSGQEYTVKGLAPGTYSIQVTDENACVELATNLFTLVNESGVLIGSDPMSEEIMLGEVATLIPDLTVPGATVFDLNWYFDSNATQVISSDPNPASDGVIYEIDGNGVLTLTNLPPGTYSYYLEISGNGVCVTLTEGIVIVKSPLTADIVTTPVTCFGGSDGTISVENIIGGTTPLSFSLDGITWQPSPFFQDLTVGMYTVYITDPTIATGFLTSFPDILIETTATQLVVNTPDIIRASCELPNGVIQNLVISGGAGGYTFEWRKDDPITGELLTNGSLTGITDLLSGTYFITVTDANGCQEVFSFIVTEIPGPVYEVVPPIDVCIGETVSIQPLFLAPNPPEPTAATEIEWYKEAGQQGLISNGPDSDNPDIIYAIDNTDWINPQLTISNLPLGSHDFYFYVVCTGQEIRVEVKVFELPEMVFETSPVTCFGDIDGKIISVSGDLPEYTYSLNGAAPISLSELESLNLAAGNYTLEVSMPAGCNQLLDLIIEGPTSALTLDPLIIIDPGCGADNGKIQGQITGGWAPYTVNLYKEGVLLSSFIQSESELALDDLSIGLYSLEIVDDKGCQIESEDLNLIDGPTQILVENQVICEGSVVTLVATLDPPVSDYSIQWYFDEAGTQPITSSPNPAADGVIYQIAATGELTLTGLPYSANPYQYFASATGPEVCVGFVARPILRVNEVPSATVSISSEQCFGEGGTITINATGGNGEYQYSLDGVNFQTSNTFTVPQGTYSAVVRAGNGCIVEVPDIILTGPNAPIVLDSVDQMDATCGQNDGSISLVLTGGFGVFEVDLILNSVIVDSGLTAGDGSITFSNLEVGAYSIQVRDSGGCEIRFDDLVEIQNVPTLISVNDVQICQGESAVLTPSSSVNSPDLQFTWYFDAAGTNPISSGTFGDQTYTIASDGILTIDGLSASATSYEYFVSATGTNICSAGLENALVVVTEIPNLRVSNPSIVCDPEGTVDLTQFIEGFNPSVYDYNVLSPSGSTMRLDELTTVDLSGDYRVSSSAKGTSCWNQPQRIRVIISESLLVAEFNYLVDFGNGNIFQNEEIPLGEDVYFNDISLGNAVIWNWDFGDGFTSNQQNPVHSYNEVGTYLVKLRVLDSIGCESIYEMMVEVQDDFQVIIPNAFTPTGNKNQFFKPEYRGIASMEFFIFNTWGELIYTTTSLEDKGWDGTLNGSDAPNGNYVYRGRFVSRGGVVVEKSGVFILIR